MAAALAWLALAGYQYWTADGGGRPTADGGGSGRRTAAAWAWTFRLPSQRKIGKKKKSDDFHETSKFAIGNSSNTW